MRRHATRDKPHPTQHRETEAGRLTARNMKNKRRGHHLNDTHRPDANNGTGDGHTRRDDDGQRDEDETPHETNKRDEQARREARRHETRNAQRDDGRADEQKRRTNGPPNGTPRTRRRTGRRTTPPPERNARHETTDETARENELRKTARHLTNGQKRDHGENETKNETGKRNDTLRPDGPPDETEER